MIAANCSVYAETQISVELGLPHNRVELEGVDPLTSHSRIMIPFFARQKLGGLILLTKGSNVGNLLDLDHQRHSILSWSLNPPQVVSAFEVNTP